MFYTGGNYPAENVGAYFFGDYVRGFIKRLRVNQNHQLMEVENFAENVGAVVDLVLGPRGDIHFLAFDDTGGALKRIRYTGGGGGNSPPVAGASANPSSGGAPLTVQFSSRGSFDPDGDQLSFHWDF